MTSNKAELDMIREQLIPLRKRLAAHGGDVVLRQSTEETLVFKVVGNCVNCAYSEEEIYSYLKETFGGDQVYNKRIVIDNSIDDDLLNQVRKILSKE